MTTRLSTVALLLVIATFLLRATSGFAQGSEGDDAREAQLIEQLVAQLDDDDAARRDQAEQELIKLGLTGSLDDSEAFLARLPKPIDQMPAEVKTRLAKIADEVQSKQAQKALAESRLSFDLTDAPLADVFAQIEKQTGNRIADHREQFGQEAAAKKLTLKIDDEPFWPAFDKLLDAVTMQPYSFSGEEALAIVDREPGALQRARRATYSGPFRIEATGLEARRGIRVPEQSGLRIELEIAWEPRLRPIALSQSAADLKAMGDDGREIQPVSQEAVFDVEIQAGSHAAEVTLPLQLPARETKTLKSLRGKMTALVPGQIKELRFKNLDKAKNATQQTGGVAVAIDRVVKNQELWEIHMRVSVDSLQAGLESHRGWVYQNLTYLEDKDGEKIDHAGFETTMQGEREAGFAYFFELPDENSKIGDYTWVYRTPVAIVSVPVEYELEDLPLP